MSEEMREKEREIAGLLGEFQFPDLRLSFDEEKCEFRLKIVNEYNFLEFKDMSYLRGYMEIAKILGCKDGDEIGRECTSEGCDTCGYGSVYEIDLRFWNPAE
jgi:hypothetical protein